MSDGFSLNTDDMRAHASNLSSVAEAIGVGRDAAGQASLGGIDAYGILCSPIMAPLMATIESAGLAAISASHTAVDATSTGIKDMADGYDEVQRMVGELFEKINSELTGGN